MIKRDTVSSYCKILGVTCPKLRNDLRNHVLNFLRREHSVKSVSMLKAPQIDSCAHLFLSDDEGKQVLRNCREGTDWEGNMGFAVRILSRLVKIWVKSAKQTEKNRRKHIDSDQKEPRARSSTLQAEGRIQPSIPELDSSPVGGVQNSDNPVLLNRVPLAAIDHLQDNAEPDLQHDEDIVNECTEDELPEVSQLTTPRKRKAEVRKDLRENWSPDTEPEITLAPTEQIEAHAEHIVINGPVTPNISSHIGLISPPATGCEAIQKREQDRDGYNPADMRPSKRVRLNSANTIQLQSLEGGEDVMTITHDYYADVEPRSSRVETRSTLDIAAQEVSRSPMTVNTAPPSVTCLLASSILISSHEVQLTHEDLTKIPSAVITYLQELEHHLARKGNTNVLGREQRRLFQEKSRLLSEIRSDIVMKILDIAQGRTQMEAPGEDIDDESL